MVKTAMPAGQAAGAKLWRTSAVVAADEAGAAEAEAPLKARLAAWHRQLRRSARRFAERLAQSPRIALDLATVQTNIVVFSLRDGAPDGAAVVAAARERGVLLFAFGPRTLRAVTHLDLSRSQVDEAAAVLADIVDAA